VSGFGFMAGVVTLFFACGIVTGVLGVMALSAMRGHRQRRGLRRYALDQAETLDWVLPRRPAGPDWEDRPGWTPPPDPDKSDDILPPWPGRRG
jgi:hypothetical protein